MLVAEADAAGRVRRNVVGPDNKRIGGSGYRESRGVCVVNRNGIAAVIDCNAFVFIVAGINGFDLGVACGKRSAAQRALCRPVGKRRGAKEGVSVRVVKAHRSGRACLVGVCRKHNRVVAVKGFDARRHTESGIAVPGQGKMYRGRRACVALTEVCKGCGYCIIAVSATKCAHIR